MTSKRNHRNPAEEARLKHKYRRLVLRQHVRLPSRLAMKLVGPDCAFHLYGQLHAEQRDSVSKK